MVAVDRNLAITFVNPEAERLLGMPMGLLSGQRVGEVLRLCDERTRQPIENPLAQALRLVRATTPGPAVIVNGADGEQCPIEANAAPIVDEKDQLLGAVLVFRDVSRKRRLEDQFVVADRLVALGTLAGGVAHEINNPLTLITNNAHFVSMELEEMQRSLREGTFDAGQAEERMGEVLAAIQDLNTGARRAAMIVEDMRRFSAHEPASRELVDVAGTLSWAIRMCAVHLTPRARVETHIGPVPNVLANRTRIAQVFMNVLINAGQALPDGDPRNHRISITAKADSVWVYVEISDTGPGMSREIRQRIFEPFFSTRGVGEGNGLGMAVAHGIVSALGGRIEIESAATRGTTVRICLPAAA